MNGKSIVTHQQHVAMRITPHARTLRKARENVRLMVADQVSPAKIKRYFSRWLHWWARTTTWDCQQLLKWFIEACWSATLKSYALASAQHYFKQSRTMCDFAPAAA